MVFLRSAVSRFRFIERSLKSASSEKARKLLFKAHAAASPRWERGEPLRYGAMELILIRHGLPLRIQREDGAPADPPLSEIGQRQAVAVGAWLAQEKIDFVYASPLRRAHETATPLAQTLGLKVEVESRVAEYDQHSDAYVPVEELKVLDRAKWNELMEKGYPEGLDLEQFREGVVQSLTEIAARHSGQRIAIFCHGGVINCWAADVLGLGFKLFFNPYYSSLNRFLVSSQGVRSVGSLNECAHLRDFDREGPK